ncbi:LysM peptidoglycan-binding domain-containing protein [Aliihoeflea sp. 2WW]|uniref:LysM peptidoglycan-binding domain-containing protein n=1 Tax=Aliihoeflea sp. 2WW TaxID=1381123 RepID=UPI00046438D4|nr:LysM peptidoglycan-binding domain-containing protein [Aliihoeflea sp. 2WW]
MVANWLKILLFAAGGSTAAVGTVYYTGIYDPWAVEESSAPMAAAEPDEPQAAVAPAEEEPATDGEAVDAAPSETAEPADVAAVAEPDAADADLVVPSFDIVRVEPDGSMVIAGSAEPNSDIEVVAGAEIIARAEVGPSGNFAAVLDDALRPGDYQIVLRSTGPGEGLVTTSLETAVVSVPDSQDGQVLALVEEPGAPSRLITVPEADTQADATPAIEALPETPATDEAVEDEPLADASEQTAAADAPDATDPADGSPQDAAEMDAPGEPEAEPAVAEGESEQQLAARSDPQTSPTQARPASPRNALAVEAIEIEGGTVFVAGRGAAGTTVRVYANEILLGEARVSEGGRFLVETQTELPVGDYIVRADIIGSSGEVTARAAVPFQREPGEAVAAVAPAERAPANAGLTPDAVSGQAVPTASAQSGEGAAASTGMASSPESDTAPVQEAPEVATAPDAETADGSRNDDAPENAAAPNASTGGADETAAAAIEETMAEPLQAADGAVIIRRGDTLWRISRRVYGRGVRYSTIYLANQEQIRDPDMIWPGQIFAVPDETEEGEKADMSTVSDQIAPLTDTQ